MMDVFTSFCTGFCRFCASCVRNKEREEQETPCALEPLDEEHESKMLHGLACLKGVQYRVGDSVYMLPEAFSFG